MSDSTYSTVMIAKSSDHTNPAILFVNLGCILMDGQTDGQIDVQYLLSGHHSFVVRPN